MGQIRFGEAGRQHGRPNVSAGGRQGHFPLLQCAARSGRGRGSGPVKQVVVNLLENAIKYTPRDGHVCLTVDSSKSQAVLEVADDGIGIPSALCPMSSNDSSGWIKRVPVKWAA